MNYSSHTHLPLNQHQRSRNFLSLMILDKPHKPFMFPASNLPRAHKKIKFFPAFNLQTPNKSPEKHNISTFKCLNHNKSFSPTSNFHAKNSIIVKSNTLHKSKNNNHPSSTIIESKTPKIVKPIITIHHEHVNQNLGPAPKSKKLKKNK